MSWTIRIGSVIAAACTGGMVSAISGMPSTPSPAKPPFDSPSRITAGTAAR